MKDGSTESEYECFEARTVCETDSPEEMAALRRMSPQELGYEFTLVRVAVKKNMPW